MTSQPPAQPRSCVCCVCMNSYDTSSHRPKLLSCGHTFCKVCLQTMGEEFECPVCRRHMSVQPGENLTFPTNFSLLDQVLTTDCRSDDEEKGASDMNSKLSVRDHLLKTCDPETRHHSIDDCHGNPSSPLCDSDMSSCSRSSPNTGNMELVCTDNIICEDDSSSSVLHKIANSKGFDSQDVTPTNSDDSEHTDEEKPSDSAENLGHIDRNNDISTNQMEAECYLNQSPGGAGVSMVEVYFDKAMSQVTAKHSQLQTEMALLQKSKDEALSDIDRYFDKMVALLNRRRHLMKTQVTDMFEEKSNVLEETMDHVTLSLLCLDKLRLHSQGFGSGTGARVTITSEIKDLLTGVEESVVAQNSLRFDEGENSAAFKNTARQLGKIQCRSMLPATVTLMLDNHYSVGSHKNIQVVVKDYNQQVLSVPVEDLSVTLTDPENHKDLVDVSSGVMSFCPSLPGQYEVTVTFMDVPLVVQNKLVTVTADTPFSTSGRDGAGHSGNQ